MQSMLKAAKTPAKHSVVRTPVLGCYLADSDLDTLIHPNYMNDVVRLKNWKAIKKISSVDDRSIA